MRVAEVVVTPVAFADPPLLNAIGVHEPWALRSIIELVSDDGLVGLGESYGDEAHLALLRQAGQAIVGLDPFALGALRQRVAAVLGAVEIPDGHGLAIRSSASRTVTRVASVLEVACLDLQGRSLAVPVHALLGGKVRDTVPFAGYLFFKWGAHPDSRPDEWGEALDPEGIVIQASRMIERYGFGSLKLKGGAFAPDEEMAAIRALRDAFPDHPLRLDPNGAWSVDTAIRVATEMGGFLQYLEDPTSGLVGMATVAARSPMPLATNMCVVAFTDLPEAIERGSVGVVLADHHYWGGLRESQRLAGICQTWGIGLSMHSNTHLGISLAAMVQLAGATPNLDYACDTHTPWQCGQDVVTEPLSFVDGAVAVPDSPGLGVDLDRDALARMHEQYLRCEIRRRDDTGYMRRFQPDFAPHWPRW